MNKQIHYHPILIAALACLLIASCTSKRKLVAPMAPVANYAWMTAKMEVREENGEVNLTGTIRMRRDSVVWVSLAAFMGMESVRACVTNDSVIVLNRIEKTYLSESLHDASEYFSIPMTLKECQAMLLGNGESDQVEVRYGSYRAKIRYSDIHWDEPTTFPININKNYERLRL